jgi:hypothetical protein
VIFHLFFFFFSSHFNDSSVVLFWAGDIPSSFLGFLPLLNLCVVFVFPVKVYPTLSFGVCFSAFHFLFSIGRPTFFSLLCSWLLRFLWDDGTGGVSVHLSMYGSAGMRMGLPLPSDVA